MLFMWFARQCRVHIHCNKAIGRNKDTLSQWFSSVHRIESHTGERWRYDGSCKVSRKFLYSSFVVALLRLSDESAPNKHLAMLAYTGTETQTAKQITTKNCSLCVLSKGFLFVLFFRVLSTNDGWFFFFVIIHNMHTHLFARFSNEQLCNQSLHLEHVFTISTASNHTFHDQKSQKFFMRQLLFWNIKVSKKTAQKTFAYQSSQSVCS